MTIILPMWVVLLILGLLFFRLIVDATEGWWHYQEYKLEKLKMQYLQRDLERQQGRKT